MNRALMVQCLEALEGVLDAKEGEAVPYWKCSGGVYEALECDKAIHALRAELAKGESFTPDWAGYRQGKDDALAEFSQEPVAWMNRSDEILPTFHRTKEAAAFWGDNPIPLYMKEPQ